MLPTDQPRATSWFETCLRKVQEWVQQEIVDDDPWDVETLFPDDPWDAKPLYPASSTPSFKASDLQRLPSERVLGHSHR